MSYSGWEVSLPMWDDGWIFACIPLLCWICRSLWFSIPPLLQVLKKPCRRYTRAEDVQEVITVSPLLPWNDHLLWCSAGCFSALVSAICLQVGDPFGILTSQRGDLIIGMVSRYFVRSASFSVILLVVKSNLLSVSLVNLLTGVRLFLFAIAGGFPTVVTCHLPVVKQRVKCLPYFGGGP